MRATIFALCLAAGCARSSSRAHVDVASTYRRLDKVHPRLDADWRQGLPGDRELVLVLDVDETPDLARWTRVGVHAAWPVRVLDRTPDGARTETASDASRSWLVHAPVDALPCLAALPWVRAIAPAVAWPTGVLDASAASRLDPALRQALGTYGRERPRTVSLAGVAQGCFDAARRDALARLGVALGSVLDGPRCEHTVFTAVVPIEVVVELASLAWVETLEAGGQLEPQAR